jgi:CheY-like chemotaxis protein
MNKTVFIIDDDPLLRLIVERMMDNMDKSLRFIPCENGKIGLDKLNDHFDKSSEYIIILDLNMPVLDGWGFLDKFQLNLNDTNENIILYILSSSTDERDIERAQQYDCVKKFYQKPLKGTDIAEILNEN